jgi:hypothetical protein
MAGTRSITELAENLRLAYYPHSFRGAGGSGARPGPAGAIPPHFREFPREEGDFADFPLAKPLTFLHNGAKSGENSTPGRGAGAILLLTEKAGDTVFVEDRVVQGGLAHLNGTGLASTSSFAKKRCG